MFRPPRRALQLLTACQSRTAPVHAGLQAIPLVLTRAATARLNGPLVASPTPIGARVQTTGVCAWPPCNVCWRSCSSQSGNDGGSTTGGLDEDEVSWSSSGSSSTFEPSVKATSKELLQWLREYALECDDDQLVAAVESVAAKGFRLRGDTLYSLASTDLGDFVPSQDVPSWKLLQAAWKTAVDAAAKEATTSHTPKPKEATDEELMEFHNNVMVKEFGADTLSGTSYNPVANSTPFLVDSKDALKTLDEQVVVPVLAHLLQGLAARKATDKTDERRAVACIMGTSGTGKTTALGACLYPREGVLDQVEPAAEALIARRAQNDDNRKALYNDLDREQLKGAIRVPVTFNSSQVWTSKEDVNDMLPLRMLHGALWSGVEFSGVTSLMSKAGFKGRLTTGATVRAIRQLHPDGDGDVTHPLLIAVDEVGVSTMSVDTSRKLMMELAELASSHMLLMAGLSSQWSEAFRQRSQRSVQYFSLPRLSRKDLPPQQLPNFAFFAASGVMHAALAHRLVQVLIAATDGHWKLLASLNKGLHELATAASLRPPALEAVVVVAENLLEGMGLEGITTDKSLLPGDALVVDCLLQRSRSVNYQYKCHASGEMTSLGELQAHGVVLGTAGVRFPPTIAPAMLRWLVSECKDVWWPPLQHALQGMLGKVVASTASSNVAHELEELVLRAMHVRALAMTRSGRPEQEEAEGEDLVTTLAKVIQWRRMTNGYNDAAEELLDRPVALRNVRFWTAHALGEASMWDAMGGNDANFVVAPANQHGFDGLVSLPRVDGGRVTAFIEVKHRTVKEVGKAVSMGGKLRGKVQTTLKQLARQGKDATNCLLVLVVNQRVSEVSPGICDELGKLQLPWAIMDATAFELLLTPGIAQLGGVLWDWALDTDGGGAPGGPARATSKEVDDA